MIENHSSCSKVSDTHICPFCYSLKIIRNGHTKTGKQQFFCKNCHKRFLDFYTYNAYKSNINHLIVQFTKEGLGIRSTARILKISATTLLKRILAIAANIPQPVIPYHQTYELDEMRFFIRKKTNPQWLVYALSRETGQVAGFYIGRRNNRTLHSVIKTLLNAKAQKIFTDKLKNYRYLIPENSHSVKRYCTNCIERENLNIRIHLKRFSRRTLCFSRSLLVCFAVVKMYFWFK